MAQRDLASEGRAGWSDWRPAAWLPLALLGAVLPLVFIPQLGDFLFYLRPADLLPAYATAWLFLAVLALPLWALGALALHLAASAHRWPRLRATLADTYPALALAAGAAALAYCLIVWLQTFGWLEGWSFRNQLFWPVIAAALALGYTSKASRWLAQMRPLFLTTTLLGALATLTLPFFSWPSRGTDGTVKTVTAAADAPATRPNIVLLTLDALSAEHMSLYGAARPTTPRLTAFAESATTFDQFYANGNFTTPGVASLLTGTRPWTHRALQLPAWPNLATRSSSLPAVLRRQGYQLGYVSTNSAAGADKNGLGSYFDFGSRDRIKDVDLCTDALSAVFRYACPIAAMPLFSELVNLAAALGGGRDAAHYDPQLAIDPAIAWLQSLDAHRPVFLWVHFFPPHSPYLTPPPWLGRFDSSGDARNIAETEPHWAYAMGQLDESGVQLLAGRYDESVQYADFYAGEFLERALKILGSHTVVVVTADHGESFRHGYGAHTGPGLYNELIRIPLIIKMPGQTQPQRVSTVSEQVDLAPTLAQLAGVSAPPAAWEGHSLLGARDPPDPLRQVPAFSMNFEQNPRFAALTTGSIAVVDGHWKLVHYLGHIHYPQMPQLHDELYDLLADPSETTNLAAQQPARVAQLRGLIDRALAAHAAAAR